MHVYIKGSWAFVQIEKDAMLCIGPKEEVIDASDEKILDMTREAVAVSKYREIESTKRLTLH